MKVCLITATQIAWHNYVKISEELIGRSPTRSLDEYNIHAGDRETFLMSLGEFRSVNINPVKFLKSASNELRHVNAGFLCEIPQNNMECIALLLMEGIVLTGNEDSEFNVFIATGSIYHWYNLIIKYMDKEYSLIIRKFLHLIYNCLLTEFKHLFSDYRLNRSQDNGFILEKK